jgi:S1-C subfamily serine protease
MIGLTTALAAVQGGETPGGFAVPLDAAMQRIIGQLRQGKEVEYGFLGVELDPNFRPGTQIKNVTEGSPAWRAGLRRGHVILKVNDEPVRDHDDLFLLVGTLLAGSEARLEVDMGQRVQTVTVTLAKFYVPTEKMIASNRPPAARGLRVDYTSVLVQRMPPAPRVYAGVTVREVLSGSPADKARLQADKVITKVNNNAVNSPADFYREMQSLTGPVQLTVLTPEGGEKQVTVENR